MAGDEDVEVLVTGITGFAGAHIAALLKRQEGVTLHGTMHQSARISPIFESSGVKVHNLDITNCVGVADLLESLRPQVVYHMAAFVSVARSFEEPARIFETNVLGTIHLMEAVKKHCPATKVVIPGSAESYGKVDVNAMPIRESQPLRPRNPYGMSKASQETIGQYYREAFGLETYLTRSFHYTGPGQPASFVCSDFAKQVAEIEMGTRDPVILVGNLEAKRDFLDIRDVVRAYAAIADGGKPGVPYNVCRGESVAISGILDTLIGMSSRSISVEVDPSKLRPVDVPDFIGDNTLLRGDTDWVPNIELKRSLEDVLSFWRRHLI